MYNYFRAERLKQKRSMNNKLLWMMPIITTVIAYLLMGPQYVQMNSYNWWYILFLPFTITFIVANMVKTDSKWNYHGLFGIAPKKQKIWYTKIGVGLGYLLICCFLFFTCIELFGYLCERKITTLENLLASMILFVCFAWQVPFYLFLTQKTNLFCSVMISIIGNAGIACVWALKSYWMCIPFCIPARLMCPVIKIMPNGLSVEKNSIFLDNNVIGIGIVIAIVWFVIFSIVTARRFEKQEV